MVADDVGWLRMVLDGREWFQVVSGGFGWFAVLVNTALYSCGITNYLILREKCPNTQFFLVRIFLYSVRIQENTDQKKLRIWALFTQCKSYFSWLTFVKNMLLIQLSLQKKKLSSISKYIRWLPEIILI